MTTVKELREKLVNSGIYTEEEAALIKGKEALQNAVDNLVETDDIFDLESASVVDDLVDRHPMDTNNPGWTDYVLSLLRENEKVDGKPTCNGLRRLTELLIGEIISSEVTAVYPPSTDDGPGRATVVYRVEVLDASEIAKGYSDLSTMPIKSVSDVADCWHGNCPNVYAVHPTATASTRAEGRCLRKLLKINIITAEENDNPHNPNEVVEASIGRQYENEHEEITTAQIALIEAKSDSLGISVSKLLSHLYGDKYITLKQLSRVDAAKLVSTINSYQNQSEVIPDEIKG